MILSFAHELDFTNQK